MTSLFKLQDFKFSTKFKSLSVSSELFNGVFPAKVEIVSNFTGEIIQFLPDAKLNEEHEWSDGVQLYYTPVVPLKNVKYLVVYHD